MHNAIEKKLNAIDVPEIHFHQIPLRQAIETLSLYVLEKDTESKGINMIVFNTVEEDPEVNLNLRNLNLTRVLDLVVRSVGYDYEINEDAIIITPSGEAPGNALQTEFFPISQATLIRMTHKAESSSQKASNRSEITFLAKPPQEKPVTNDYNNEQALKDFFERAGGSPSRQNIGSVPAGSIYNNPKIITPGGIIDRKNKK